MESKIKLDTEPDEETELLNFKSELKKRTEKAEQILQKFLPAEENYQRVIMEAVNYSFLSGGKRLRPVLMMETYRMFGGRDTVIEPFMAAMEMIHTYSLVHDDLPAMDNDEFRRGRKTTHIVYGEAMGILAGDALLNLAFETALKAFCSGTDPARIGTALIEASMMTGAVLAGADSDAVAVLERAANQAGVAFQIQDDILDVTGTLEELGKTAGSDAKNQKVTYVSLYGKEAARKQAELLTKEAIAGISSLPVENKFLIELLRYFIMRKK